MGYSIGILCEYNGIRNQQYQLECVCTTRARINKPQKLKTVGESDYKPLDSRGRNFQESMLQRFWNLTGVSVNMGKLGSEAGQNLDVSGIPAREFLGRSSSASEWYEYV